MGLAKDLPPRPANHPLMAESNTGYIIAPEPPAGPLTARNIEDFVECPRKYLLSHFSTRAHTREFIGGPAALHRAVRAALLDMYAVPEPRQYPLEALLAGFEENWDGAACADSREEEDLHRDGIAMLARHHEEPLPVGGEVSTDLRLEHDIAGHVFVAVADVVASEPPTLVRFTTSRRPPSPGELQDDLSWALLHLLGLRHFAPAEPVCVMADLRKGRQVAYALDASARARVEARLTASARRIRGEREFAAITGRHCRWCRSRRECPAWHRG